MYVRSSTWHAITAAAHHYDATFIAWRFLLRRIAKELVRKGKCLTKLQEEATKALESAIAAGDGAMDAKTKEQHKAAMQEIKKKAGRGNHILICPMLMHNANFFNMRLLLQVGQYLWSEQTALSEKKRTPEGQFHYSISLSTGHGEQLLKRMWWDTVSRHSRFIAIDAPGASSDNRHPRWMWRLAAAAAVLQEPHGHPCPTAELGNHRGQEAP